jgi:hypothetical protein
VVQRRDRLQCHQRCEQRDRDGKHQVVVEVGGVSLEGRTESVHGGASVGCERGISSAAGTGIVPGWSVARLPGRSK